MASLVTLATLQLSAVAGVPRATPVAVHKPASTLTVTSAGQVIVGFSSSVIVTVKLQVALLTAASSI